MSLFCYSVQFATMCLAIWLLIISMSHIFKRFVTFLLRFLFLFERFFISWSRPVTLKHNNWSAVLPKIWDKSPTSPRLLIGDITQIAPVKTSKAKLSVCIAILGPAGIWQLAYMAPHSLMESNLGPNSIFHCRQLRGSHIFWNMTLTASQSALGPAAPWDPTLPIGSGCEKTGCPNRDGATSRLCLCVCWHTFGVNWLHKTGDIGYQPTTSPVDKLPILGLVIGLGLLWLGLGLGLASF